MNPLLILLAVAGLAFYEKRKASPVHPGQAAASSTAPRVSGHAMPAPPLHSRTELNAFADALAQKTLAGYPDPGAQVLAQLMKAQLAKQPWPDAAGIWRDDNGSGGDGVPHRFVDCSGKAYGHPGYMPLSYLTFLQSGMGCDGQPVSPYLPSDDPETSYQNAIAAAGADPSAAAAATGGVSAGQVIQTASQVVGAASTIATTASAIAGAGAAASSGASAAGAVAAGVGAAVACLGPRGDVHEAGTSEGTWGEYLTRSLSLRAAGRVLAVNVYESKGRHVISAVESTDGAPVEPVALLRALYADHAHDIIGSEATLAEAVAVAERYAARWAETRRREATRERCLCGEVAA